MSARAFSLTRAIWERPDERHLPDAEKRGPGIAIGVVSLHLKSKPWDLIRLTEDEALVLLRDLSQALLTGYGSKG